MRNTNTLIFTMGDHAMEMPLSFPLDKCDAGNSKEYHSHPLLTIPLLGGTLLIYAPLGGPSPPAPTPQTYSPYPQTYSPYPARRG